MIDEKSFLSGTLFSRKYKKMSKVMASGGYVKKKCREILSENKGTGSLTNSGKITGQNWKQ